MGRVGKGMGGHTPVGCSSPVKRPTKNWRAAPLALSPPLGKEGRDETKGVKAWEKRETDGTEQAVTLHRPTGHNQQGPVWRQLLWRPRRGDAGVRRRGSAIFSFSYFLISFFTKIYFCFRNLQEYTPAAPLPGGRHLAAPLPDGRGFSAKSFAENLRPDPWRTGRPAAGRLAPQAARLRGDRLPLHCIRVWLPPHPSFASLKIQKKKKREEGGRGGVRERGEAAKPCRIFKPATAGNQNFLHFTNRLCCNYFY